MEHQVRSVPVLNRTVFKSQQSWLVELLVIGFLEDDFLEVVRVYRYDIRKVGLHQEAGISEGQFLELVVDLYCDLFSCVVEIKRTEKPFAENYTLNLFREV